jgi:PAS domain S-box-containing protein
MANGLKVDFPQNSEKGAAPYLKAGNSPLSRLAARESSLWQLVLVVLMALALGVAAVAWPQVPGMTWHQMILPIGLVVLVILFGLYALSKIREMSELRGLVQGLEQRATQPPDIGQLEKLFDLVRHSQQGYRDLIDTFEDLLFSVSMNGDILAANRSFADLLEHSFADLVGRPLDNFLELSDGKGRATAQKALPRFLEQRHWSGVLRVRLKHDSSTHFFQCALHALVRDGQDQGVCIYARDITQERENEARFTELFETLQEGVYLATPDGKFEDVNPSLARMLGFDNREELLDHPLAEFLIEPEAWEIEQRELNRSGSIEGHEVTLRRRDGSQITCLHAAAMIRDTGGRVRRHQGTLMNITERREMQTRLYREQEFARRLVQSFPDLVVALDLQKRFTFVSPRMMELLGYTAEEIVGTPLGERMDPHDRKEVDLVFADLISGVRQEATIEYLTQHKNGEMRLFRATASPLLSTSGEIEGIIASARDITETKRMEQQLIQTERLVAMGQMIAGVAHELNNPLTAVLGVTELLRDSSADEQAKRQLDLAHRQARRAAQIVQNLLSFSRPPQPHKTCVQISEIIQRSLQLHEHSLRTNRITVDFVPKLDLPPVLGDASQLTQVFLNLISNAEQAIREVREQGTLRIRVTALGDNVVAAFQDDGAGIRRDILPKLFDPFFTTKRPGRGTGLGLSICLAILREHNGQIQAQSLSDGGAVFTVTVPIARGTEMFLTETASPALRALTAPLPSDHLAGCSVLVVDDEESIRDLVRDGLDSRKVRVDVAASGEEAQRLLERNSYSAVLCDLNLRNGSGNIISGRDLYGRVMGAASTAAKPFFLFMTGEFVEVPGKDELAVMGARMLQKPFRISELLAILTEALDNTATRIP